MNKIDLKELVRYSIKSEWSAFASEHPRLADVLDEDLLVEQAAQSIADDPEYQITMEQSRAIGIGADAIASLVARFVAAWLKRLL